MEHILSSQLIISLFIILILYNQKNSLKFTSEKILFGYLLLLMIRSMIELLTSNIDYLLKLPYLVFVNQSTYFLDGLFIYLYVLVLKDKKLFTVKTLLLSLPFLTFLSITLVLIFKTDTTVLREFIIEVENNNAPIEWNSIGTLYFLLAIAYNMLLYINSLLIFRKSYKTIKKTISKKYDLNYKWQRMFINSWFFLYFLPFAITFIILYSYGSNSIISEYIFSISILLLTFIFGLKKIKIKYEELNLSNEEFSIKQIVKSQNKYGTLKLDETKADQLKENIEELIQDKDILSDLDLNLASFSKKLNEKEYLISQVINTLYNKNFQEFINSYRIEYAKTILTQKPEIKIIHVALDCGYKSTVTFNRQFKKYEGMTPSEYRNNFKI